MVDNPLELHLADTSATGRLARHIGTGLTPGDTVLLSGDIGAGKTDFCRALILSRLSQPEDVPSPTFTLVQTYDVANTEIWHADLYRLTDTTELVELGLTEAFDDAICLVEWPDRLGPLAPAAALGLELRMGPDPDARLARLTWSDDKWRAILDGVQIDDT